MRTRLAVILLYVLTVPSVEAEATKGGFSKLPTPSGSTTLRQAARTQMLARNHSPVDDCRCAHLRRYSLGASPISRLKTRLKELSDPYPTAEATSAKDVLFARIRPPALYIRHCVRYSRGVWPKTVLNFRANADLDMRASRASDLTDQFLSRPECIACIALLRCLSDTAANHPFGGAAELFVYARIA
jgi:hypothetical protein